MTPLYQRPIFSSDSVQSTNVFIVSGYNEDNDDTSDSMKCSPHIAALFIKLQILQKITIKLNYDTSIELSQYTWPIVLHM